MKENGLYDRFDLEEAIQKMAMVEDDIETIMYSFSDSPTAFVGHPSEDKILNMLIGAKELHKVRQEKLFHVFEDLIKNKIIK